MEGISTPPPLDPATSFKGHPHPTINERLAQAKNFLADEDINRSLRFTQHLAEIEEYLKYVEDEKIDRDTTLFQDVKTMAKVQRDWTNRMDAAPWDVSYNDAFGVPQKLSNISTRLVDSNTSKKVEEERGRNGLVTQMRADHAPFTVHRADDQESFLEEMTKDAIAQPNDVNPKENLLCIEEEAYNWALNQPALIPYWMHRERGLPNKGIKQSDPNPWYRISQIAAPYINKRFMKRPPADILPDYLHELEKSINLKLLAENATFPIRTSEGLIEILYTLEPDFLQQLHDNVKSLQARSEILTNLGLLEHADTRDLEDSMVVFRSEFDKWRLAIPEDGVQIKILREDAARINAPGVFYLPIEASKVALRGLAYSEKAINNLLSLPESDRTTTSNSELKRLLTPFRPADLRSLEAILVGDAKQEGQSPAAPATSSQSPYLSLRQERIMEERNLQYRNWIEGLRKMIRNGGELIRLKFTLPGEHGALQDPNVLTCTWPNPYFSNRAGDLPQVPPEIKKLESEINDLLQGLTSSSFESTISSFEWKVAKKLESVMYPRLRQLTAEYQASENYRMEHSFDDDQSQKHSALEDQWIATIRKWIRCLKLSVVIRMPSGPDVQEDPNVLFYRGYSVNLGVENPIPTEPNAADFEAWAQLIQDSRLEHPLSENWVIDDTATDRGSLYNVLANLQYPTLKRMDLEWTGLYAKDDPTQSEIQHRPVLREAWRQAFFAWQANFGDGNLDIRRPEAWEDAEYGLDDPGVVYFRGPISESSPDLGQSSLNVLAASRILPAAEHKDQDMIQEILDFKRMGNLDRWKSSQGRLQKAIQVYWRPSRNFHNFVDTRSTNSEVQAQRLHEYNLRYAYFITECLERGFYIEQTPNGHFIAHDWTVGNVEKWNVPELENPDLDSTINFTYLLNDLWRTPVAFQEQVSDLECEINELLRDYNNTRFEETHFSRLIQILRPFLPASLQDLIAETPVHRISLETPEHSLHHDLDLLDLIQTLARKSRLEWITLQYPGATPVEIIDNGLVHNIIIHDLYFTPPMDIVPDIPIEAGSASYSNGDELPLGFQRMEQDMNDLLFKRRAGLLTFNDWDELRNIFHAVMSPTLARLDNVLRGEDVCWRAGQLDFWEVAGYKEKSVHFYQRLDQWLDTFEENDIRLFRVRTEYATANDLVLRIENPWDMPPNFKSVYLPVSTLNVQVAINDYIMNQPDGTDPYYEELIKSLFWSHQLRWKSDAAKKIREQHGLSTETELGLEFQAEVDTTTEYELNYAVSKLKRQLRNDTNPKLLVMFERRRGELDWFLGEQYLYSQEFRIDGSMQLEDWGAKELSDVATSSWIQEARSEFFNLVVKVKNNSMSDTERNKIRLLLAPLPPGEESLYNNEVVETFILSREARPLTIQHQTALKQAYLRLTWRTFFDSHPELENNVFSSSPDPIRTLLKRDMTQPLRQTVTKTDDQINKIAAELNGMLALSQRGELLPERDSILDFLLRPLARGYLANLFERITSLNEKRLQSSGKELSMGENITLVEYKKQYDEDFQEWKLALPPGGIILDELYNGTSTVNEVVSRYREWKKAVQSDNVSAPVIPDNLALEDAQKYQLIYSVLKQFVFTGIVNNIQQLLLDQIPPRLKQILDEMYNYLDQQNSRELKGPERLLLRQLQRIFVQSWIEWYERVTTTPQHVRQQVSSTRTIDFTGKAERRGVQRAAIELGLNVLTTSQEQHRPHDRFRRIELPQSRFNPKKETPLCLPLEPWKRPIEVDPLKYTKILRKFREWKDWDYEAARNEISRQFPGSIRGPNNFTGPYTVISDVETAHLCTGFQIELLELRRNLIMAERSAPRPLLEKILITIDESCATVRNGLGLSPESATIGRTLTSKQLEALKELAQQSWPEHVVDYPESIPGIEANPPWSMERLGEFERDLQSVWSEIPFWHPSQKYRGDAKFKQLRYNPHQASIGDDGLPRGWQVVKDINSTSDIEDPNCVGLLHYINNLLKKRAAERGDWRYVPWDSDEVIEYLTAMKNCNRIFYDQARNLVARITPSGHPENKYVVSEEELTSSLHIMFNVESNEYEVQYDARGHFAPPISQPNKFEFLEQAALSLGREIGVQALQLADGGIADQDKLLLQQQSTRLIREHMEASRGVQSKSHVTLLPGPDISVAKDISLPKLARDLSTIAPHLLKEAGVNLPKPGDPMTERDAAKIVQMSVLEEENNCWERLFPEAEHIWDFTIPVLNSTFNLPSGRTVKPLPLQYFHMRRWPPQHQPRDIQNAVSNRSLLIQEKPASSKPAPPVSRAEAIAAQKKKLREEGRHTGKGGTPYFTMGETPVQQSWISHEIGLHLADVDEFYPKPNQPTWFQKKIISKLRRFPFLGRDNTAVELDIDSSSHDEEDSDYELILPKVPLHWDPNSVSGIEKRYDISEKLLEGQDGQSKPQAEELYFSPVEVQARNEVREQWIIELLKAEARKEIENYCGMEWRYIKEPKRREARQALDIDPVTEVMRNSKILAAQKQTRPSLARSASSITASQNSTTEPTPASGTRPSDSTRSKPSLKRQSSDSTLRGRSVKKTRIVAEEPGVPQISRRSALSNDEYSVDVVEGGLERWRTV